MIPLLWTPACILMNFGLIPRAHRASTLSFVSNSLMISFTSTPSSINSLIAAINDSSTASAFPVGVVRLASVFGGLMYCVCMTKVFLALRMIGIMLAAKLSGVSTGSIFILALIDFGGKNLIGIFDGTLGILACAASA